MTAADPGWLLRAWERGAAASPVARGAVLCEAADVTPTLDAALDLSLDELAGALARMYLREFGPTADGLLTCDHCGEVLDVEVPLCLLADSDAPTSETVLTTPSGRLVRLRVPTTRDLLDARDRDDVAAALVERCVADATPSAAAPGLAEPLDTADLTAVDSRLQSLAGAAAVSVTAVCPSCGTALSAPVDVAGFVWEQVRQQAPALLADITALASAFGWTEHEILALSPMRRNAYLAMVRRVVP
jgi:hypothetical protein